MKDLSSNKPIHKNSQSLSQLAAFVELSAGAFLTVNIFAIKGQKQIAGFLHLGRATLKIQIFSCSTSSNPGPPPFSNCCHLS